MARIAPGVDLFDLQPEVRNALLTAQAELDKAGIDSTVTSAARTRGAQEQLYNAYLARGKTGLPAAPPGGSKHETGQAVDFSIPEQQRDAANQILAKHGFNWFGPGDRVHYTYGGPSAQRTFAPQDLSQQFAAGGGTAPQDLSHLFTPAAPRPQKAAPAAPAPQDFSQQFASGKAQDLSHLFASAPAAPAPAAPAYRPAVAAPGALSAPQPPQPLPGAIFAAPPSVQQKENIQAQHNLQIPQRLLNTVNTPITAASHYLNQVSRKLGEHQERGYNPPFDFSAFVEAARETPWSKLLLQSLKGQTAEFPTPVRSFGEGAPSTSVGKFVQQHPVATDALDFALSFPVLELVGEAQNAAVGRIGQGLRIVDQGAQITPRLLNRLPAVKRLVENGDIQNAVSEVISKNQAGYDRFIRDTAKTAEDARMTSQKYLQQGVKLGYKSADTGQKVNLLEELVADYMDAGNPGSKYEAHGIQARTLYQTQRAAELRHVAADAAAHGIDMADVRRIGDAYTRSFTELGQHLVNFGLLDPDAYRALQGQYLPRLYLLTKGDPGDVSRFIKFLESEGALTPEAMAEANQRGIANPFARPGIGPKEFRQSRELLTYDERTLPEFARAAVPEATPAALHGIQAQTRAAGLGAGMAEIAQNPEWAIPADQLTVDQMKQGWSRFEGKGPLAGLAIHPAVRTVLEAQMNPNRWRNAAVQLFGHEGANRVMAVQQGMRKLWLSRPSTIGNIATGHFWFTQPAAREAGTSFSLLDYAKALRDVRRGSGQYLDEAMNRTDLLRPSAGLLPKAAKRVSGGVGLETSGQNALRLGKAAVKKYSGLTHDILAGGKFGLYRQLRRKGLGIDQAARITRNATINYQKVWGPIRFLDQGMISPFITFGWQALALGGKMALRHPDLTAMASGHQLTWYLDRMADHLAVSRGQQPQAVAARERGEVGPTSFAIPGQVDEHGRQIYKQVPWAAPLLHHLAAGGTRDITDPLRHQLLNAAPIAQVPIGLAHNLDLRQEPPRPIVPEGLQPGSGLEAARARANWLLSVLAPPVASGVAIVNAAQGVTPYAAPGKKPQTTSQAVEQFLTGNRTGTANQLMGAGEAPPGSTVLGGPRNVAVLQQMRAASGERYGQFALDYFENLVQHLARDAEYVPEKKYAEVAREMSDPKLKSEMDAAMQRLRAVTYGEQYTGKDREATIRRMIDWTYTLAHEMQRRGMTPPYRKIGGALGVPLAQMRDAPP